jgi:hypothetical protein
MYFACTEVQHAEDWGDGNCLLERHADDVHWVCIGCDGAEDGNGYAFHCSYDEENDSLCIIECIVQSTQRTELSVVTGERTCTLMCNPPSTKVQY